MYIAALKRCPARGQAGVTSDCPSSLRCVFYWCLRGTRDGWHLFPRTGVTRGGGVSGSSVLPLGWRLATEAELEGRDNEACGCTTTSGRSSPLVPEGTQLEAEAEGPGGRAFHLPHSDPDPLPAVAFGRGGGGKAKNIRTLQGTIISLSSRP